MEHLLNHKVFGLEVWNYIAAIAAILIFFNVWSWLSARQPKGNNTYNASCSCGWRGEASRVAKRCPNCLARLS